MEKEFLSLFVGFLWKRKLAGHMGVHYVHASCMQVVLAIKFSKKTSARDLVILGLSIYINLLLTFGK